MLLAILLFFLMSELPVGLIYLLVGVLGNEFADSVYQPLGDLMDVLALINASINFILLATMSRVFRKTFCGLFFPKKYRQRLHSSGKMFRFARKKEAVIEDEAVVVRSTSSPIYLKPQINSQKVAQDDDRVDC